MFKKSLNYTHAIQQQLHDVREVLNPESIATLVGEEGGVKDEALEGIHDAYTTGYSILLGSDLDALANVLERCVTRLVCQTF